jgi:uncharacterized protein YndB with AHSA1/START domain
MTVETMGKSDASTADRELVLVRVLDAPRKLVFKAWTDAKALAQWWGPKGFTNPQCEADARPGGKWRIVMRGPDGAEYPHGGEYIEVTPPSKIVMTNALEGDIHPFGPSVWTITFEETDGKTTLTTRVLCETQKDRDAMDGMGWRGGYGMSLDKLNLELAIGRREAAKTLDLMAFPGAPVMMVTRWFDAPVDLVFEAVSSPKHFGEWWGPRGYVNTIHEMDVRVGGKWRVDQRDEQGRVHPFHGEYLEIDPPSRLVLTQAYRDTPALRMEMNFAPKAGGTQLTAVMKAPSPEIRDGMIKAGMEWGMRQSYERLDELLARLGK